MERLARKVFIKVPCETVAERIHTGELKHHFQCEGVVIWGADDIASVEERSTLYRNGPAFVIHQEDGRMTIHYKGEKLLKEDVAAAYHANYTPGTLPLPDEPKWAAALEFVSKYQHESQQIIAGG